MSVNTPYMDVMGMNLEKMTMVLGRSISFSSMFFWGEKMFEPYLFRTHWKGTSQLTLKTRMAGCIPDKCIMYSFDVSPIEW